MVGSIFGLLDFWVRTAPKSTHKPPKIAILRTNLKMMFPNPQSVLERLSIVVFSAKNDGGVHFGEQIFW